MSSINLILRSRAFAPRLEGWPLARPCLRPSFVLREPQHARILRQTQQRAPQDEVRGFGFSLHDLIGFMESIY